ncbi:hypothetical protein EDD28_0055 [Salana multivorans]|uniref:Uncharacterized protein n=1 Tax=Salana multivorans TaxID=120377 RepID=A0A3N2D6W7_9MICO|nr:hypothetical protein [Salana multivorans]ROR95502.1 hypothetical protein EDD28_0055 [Salana multivorans]
MVKVNAGAVVLAGAAGAARVAREGERWGVGGDNISDDVARTVAAWWQSSGSVGSALAALASGADVSVDDVAADCAALLRGTVTVAEANTLSALRAWAIARDAECVLWVCVDCMLAHHYPGEGEASGECEPWALLDEGVVTAGLDCGTPDHHAADPNAHYEGCDRRDFDAGDCEGCGSALAGERYAFTWWPDTSPAGMG